MRFQPLDSIKGAPRLPGDKSISHRCLIMASLANGESSFKNISMAEDVLSTQKVLMNLGIEIVNNGNEVRVVSKGQYTKPKGELNCGNAGTLMRLMMGVLSGQPFDAILTGDQSLSQRPMKRVLNPLLQMGARLELKDNEFAPIQIKPSQLSGIHYDLPVASAQVKSAILLAALNAKDQTILSGKIYSRDHTERLLKHFGAEVKVTENEISIQGHQQLRPASYFIPNDISAASFWIAATLLAKDGHTEFENVGVNPTRMGFVDVLKTAGANIEIKLTANEPEPVASIKTLSSKLSGFHILKNQISSLVDEVPLLTLIATQCNGNSIIEGVEELRFKETDRVMATVESIRALGGNVEVIGNDLHIEGNQSLSGGRVNSYGDHRIAMMAAVARFVVSDDIEISEVECVNISDPYFLSEMTKMGVR